MKSPLLIILTLGATLCCGCRTSRFQTVSDKTSAQLVSRQLEESRRAEAMARFATGISYEANHHADLALEQFELSAAADPANEALVLELAGRFAEGKDFDKAIALLSKSADQSQTSGNILSALARIYLEKKETNLAITASQKAIKKSPALIAGYQSLVKIFLESDRPDEAAKVLNVALSQTNVDAVFLINLADLYTKVARAEPKEAEPLKKKSLGALQRAADLQPTDPNVRQKLADRLVVAGDAKRAAELYLGLLNEFRDMSMMRDILREKLTNLYLQDSDKSKAAEQLEAVVRDSPTRYPEAWYYLATFANDAKNYAKAADYFERALLLNPDMEQAYYDFALMRISNDQPGEALKILEKAQAKFSNSFIGEFFSAMAFTRLKNTEEAIKHFTTAEVIAKATDPKRLNYLFYFQLGAAYERHGDFEQAENSFEKCLEMSPDFPDALNYLGFMWADRGVKLERAREMIEKAVKLEPKNDAYLDSLGWVLYKLKEYEPALRYLLQSVELTEKPDAAVYDHLGDTYSALQQKEKAREAWEKSLSIEPNADVKRKLDPHSAL